MTRGLFSWRGWRKEVLGEVKWAEREKVSGGG